MIEDHKNELEENLLETLKIRYLQYPCISITDSVFLIPTLIQYRLPNIQILTSLTNEKIKVGHYCAS